MTAITLPADLQAWAEAEVAAGRAHSVDKVVTDALDDYRAHWNDLRKSLDDAEAEADELGWLDAREVFDRIQAELRAEIEIEEAEDSRRAKAG